MFINLSKAFARAGRSPGASVAAGVICMELQHKRCHRLHPLLHAISSSYKLHDALRAASNGSAYRFTGMSELQIGRSAGWHRDLLHGRERVLHMRLDPWVGGAPTSGFGGRFGLWRLIMYLEDHQDPADQNALQVVPGSHHIRGCQRPCWSERPADDMASCVLLHPRKGDAILFDQRLIHRGQALDSPAGHDIFAKTTRMTLQLSFGVENNRITNEWAKGDEMRRQRILSYP